MKILLTILVMIIGYILMAFVTFAFVDARHKKPGFFPDVSATVKAYSVVFWPIGLPLHLIAVAVEALAHKSGVTYQHVLDKINGFRGV